MKAKSTSAAAKGEKVPYEYSGTLDVLIKVVKNDGPLGLFRGIEAKLWQTVLTAAFQFTTYEKIVQLVRNILLRQQEASSK